MYVPDSACEGFADLHLALAHQKDRLFQFNIQHEDRKDYEACLTLLGTLTRYRIFEAGALGQVGGERPYDPGIQDWRIGEYARIEHLLNEIGCDALAEILANAQEFMRTLPADKLKTQDDHYWAFADPALEAHRMDLQTRWDGAVAALVPKEVITRIMDHFGIETLPDAQYDTRMLDRILASDGFRRRAQNADVKMSLGSDGDLRSAAEKAGVTFQFEVWSFADRNRALVQTSAGLLTVPRPPARISDPMVRKWPKGTELFEIGAENATARQDNQDRLSRFANAVKTIEATQTRLTPRIGGQLASLVARFCHPIATYRMFWITGGFGCPNAVLFPPWRDSVFASLGLLSVYHFFDAPRAFQNILHPGDIAFATWALATCQTLMTGMLLIALPAQLITGIALLHGTLLRGLGHPPVNGATNLPQTGKTNAVLRLMGHKG